MRRDSDVSALVDQASRYHRAERGDYFLVSGKHPLDECPCISVIQLRRETRDMSGVRV